MATAADATLLYRDRLGAKGAARGANGDRICQPGPGRATLSSDAGYTWDDTGAWLSFSTAQAPTADIVMSVVTTFARGASSFLRSDRPCFVFTVQIDSVNNDPLCPSWAGGFLDSGTFAPEALVQAFSATAYQTQAGHAIYAGSAGDTVRFAIQIDTSGAYYFAQADTVAGGWGLVSVMPYGTGATLSATPVLVDSAVGRVKGISLFQFRRLVPNLLVDITPPVGATDYEGHSDVLIDFGVTYSALTAGQYAEILYRYVDANNHWRLRLTVNAGGTAVDAILSQVTAGSATTRNTVTGVINATGTFYVQHRAATYSHLSAVRTSYTDGGPWTAGASYTQLAASVTDGEATLRVNKSGAGVALVALKAWQVQGCYRLGEI